MKMFLLVIFKAKTGSIISTKAKCIPFSGSRFRFRQLENVNKTFNVYKVQDFKSFICLTYDG